MSERRFDDSPASDDERALRAAWQADTPPQPDARLDARVRAAVEAQMAAEQPTRSATVIRPARWRHLRIPLALAATVLLSFGAIRIMFPTVMAPPMPVEHERAAPAPAAQIESDTPPPEATTPATVGIAAHAPVPAPAKPSSEAASARVVPRAEAVQRREVPATEAPRAVAPAMSKTMPATTPALADSASEAAIPAAPPAPAPDSAVAEPRRAAPAAVMKQRAFSTLSSPRMAPTSGAADPTEAGRADSKAALARIQAMVERGEREAATRALKEWVAAHPQEKLPDWARALLQEAAPLLP
ncbi:MAG: hypothetical protein R3E45_08575 [Rhodocyclaceae bacterium]